MSCGCSAPLGDNSLNTYNGPVPPGVPNPFTPMLHSFPTRYHGPVYTRPMNNFPWRERPYDFALEEGMQGLGTEGEASDKSLPPAWKFGVAMGLTALTVFAVVKWADSQPRHGRV